jgi:phosphate transport system substrate-binding protein
LRKIIGRTLVIAALSLLVCGPTLAAANLTETGSTLLYPLMNTWVRLYETQHPDVSVDTTASNSGVGISAALSGESTIGASDAYLDESQLAAGAMNIAVAVSAQQVNYNVPEAGSTPIKLSADVLAKIYSGTVRTWNDPAIASLNPGVALPSKTIVPIHRSDASGDTLLFTQYLASGSADWRAKLGSGKSLAWPNVSGEQIAKGNAAMVQAVRDVPYALAYVGVSYLEQAKEAHLGYAALMNKRGKFVAPTDESLRAAAVQGASVPSRDERISLIDVTGPNAYPIVNFEYVILQPSKLDADTKTKLAGLLDWIIDPTGGNAPSVLSRVHFVALPAPVRALSKAMIAKLSGK